MFVSKFRFQTRIWYVYRVDKGEWLWSPYKPKTYRSALSKFRWNKVSSDRVQHNIGLFISGKMKGRRASKQTRAILSFLNEHKEAAINYLKQEIEANPSMGKNTMKPMSERLYKPGTRWMYKPSFVKTKKKGGRKQKREKTNAKNFQQRRRWRRL